MAVELGAQFKVQLSASHIISKSQLQIFTVGQGFDNTELLGTYKNMELNRVKIESQIGRILANILDKIPGGVLFFLPSHNALASMIATWQKTGIIDEIQKLKTIFFEEQNNNYKINNNNNNQNKSNDQLYLDYKDCIEKKGGAILFGVCRGRMSEGIDFYDDQARCVIVFGIPYPPKNDRDIRLKMQFNDERCEDLKIFSENSGMSGSEWYDAQAYRALFQATGRCIRHARDYGTVILIDSRFSKQIGRFPHWMQQSFVNKNVDTDVNVLPELLSNFYKEMQIEFPPRSFLRKSSPTTICCQKCECQIVEVESLDENNVSCLQVNGRPGLHEICQMDPDDGFLFIKKKDQKRISDQIVLEEAIYSNDDEAAYQPIICSCGQIVGALFKVGKLIDITSLDGMFLDLNKIVGNQGKVFMPITTVLEVKRTFTFAPQGKGQQILCLTPNVS